MQTCANTYECVPPLHSHHSLSSGSVEVDAAYVSKAFADDGQSQKWKRGELKDKGLNESLR